MMRKYKGDHYFLFSLDKGEGYWCHT